MDGLDHLFILVRAGDREHLRMRGADRVGFLAHAAGDNHAAVFGNRLTDRGKAFLLGAVEKPAGIDQHHIGARVILGKGIAIGAQAREDPFGINQRLGAAEADHADGLLVRQSGGSDGHSGAPLHCVCAPR